jgi:hypothetical protein
MLKLGICTAMDDTPLHRWWRRGLIAANMLPTNPHASSEELDRFERIILQLRLSDGTFRATIRNRLAAIDEKVGSILPSIFPLNSNLLVEDWAVSSGITAAEWFQSLQQLYPNITFTASDRVLYLVEAQLKNERGAFIVEPGGEAIQYIRAPFVVSLSEMQHPFYFINRSVQRRAIRKWRQISRDLRVPAAWEHVNGSSQTLSLDKLVLRRLPLIHPQVMEMRSEHFLIKQHNIFTPLSKPVHVIRTMNVLNRSYFTASRLQSAADAIRQSLYSSGLWIVGRTVKDNPPDHEVTIVQKTRCGWETVLRIGKGSEMESILSPGTPATTNV